MGRVKQIWYLSPMRAAKVQASLCIRAVLPEPPLLAHTSSESRGTFRQKARSLAPLNGWACTVKICHDGIFEDTNSLEAPQMVLICNIPIGHRLIFNNEHLLQNLFVCPFRLLKRLLRLSLTGCYLVRLPTIRLC